MIIEMISLAITLTLLVVMIIKMPVVIMIIIAMTGMFNLSYYKYGMGR